MQRKIKGKYLENIIKNIGNYFMEESERLRNVCFREVIEVN